MWTILMLMFCAVYPAQTIVLHQDTGPIHIHKKSNAPHLNDSPLQPDDVEATKSAEAFLKDLLPKLDTKIEKSVNSINFDEVNAEITLALNNFVLKGFRHASLDNLIVRMSKSRVDFNASIPILLAGGSVFVSGIIDENEFDIVANLSSFLDDIKITGILDFQKLQLPSEVYVIQITDVDIKIDISDLMFQFTIIEELLPFKLTLMQFMNKPVDDLVKSVSRSAVRLVNEELAKIPADTIIDYLVPSQTQPPAKVPPVKRRPPYPLRSYYPNDLYGVN